VPPARPPEHPSPITLRSNRNEAGPDREDEADPNLYRDRASHRFTDGAASPQRPLSEKRVHVVADRAPTAHTSSPAIPNTPATASANRIGAVPRSAGWGQVYLRLFIGHLPPTISELVRSRRPADNPTMVRDNDPIAVFDQTPRLGRSKPGAGWSAFKSRRLRGFPRGQKARPGLANTFCRICPLCQNWFWCCPGFPESEYLNW
jgi:hypothetical protein